MMKNVQHIDGAKILFMMVSNWDRERKSVKTELYGSAFSKYLWYFLVCATVKILQDIYEHFLLKQDLTENL